MSCPAPQKTWDATAMDTLMKGGSFSLRFILKDNQQRNTWKISTPVINSILTKNSVLMLRRSRVSNTVVISTR